MTRVMHLCRSDGSSMADAWNSSGLQIVFIFRVWMICDVLDLDTTDWTGGIMGG